MKLAELVVPSTTVILTQECQRGIIGDLAHPAMREAAESIGMVENIGRLVKAGRDAGCAVLHCIAEMRPNHPASASNAPILRSMQRMMGEAPAYDPAVMEVVDGIETAPSDVTSVRAVNISPIIGTEVPTLLRNLGATTVVAVGVSSNLGIPNLTFDCVNLGFNVVIPRDGIVGLPTEHTESMLQHTLAMVAKLTTTDELLEAWAAS